MQILQWSYPYAYFEFEDRALNDYSSFSAFDAQTRRQRARREDHRTVFEMLQAEMESMVETLSGEWWDLLHITLRVLMCGLL
jgi:hypothetical protein